VDINRCERCFEVKDSGTCHHCGYPYGSVNDSHQLCEGTLLRSRYRIGRVLGQGGFGITYLGWDTLLDKKVAVKEFYPRSTVSRRSDRMTVHCSETALLGSYESSRKRFLREARALAILTARYYDRSYHRDERYTL